MQIPKQVNLEDILTPEEVERARILYREQSDESFNSRLVREILEPNMDRINQATGQVNHPRYIGYAIEWCLMKEKNGNAKKSTTNRDDRHYRARKKRA